VVGKELIREELFPPKRYFNDEHYLEKGSLKISARRK
jgi:hypothetical protein